MQRNGKSQLMRRTQQAGVIANWPTLVLWDLFVVQFRSYCHCATEMLPPTLVTGQLRWEQSHHQWKFWFFSPIILLPAKEKYLLDITSRVGFHPLLCRSFWHISAELSSKMSKKRKHLPKWLHQPACCEPRIEQESWACTRQGTLSASRVSPDKHFSKISSLWTPVWLTNEWASKLQTSASAFCPHCVALLSQCHHAKHEEQWQHHGLSIPNSP